MNKIHIFHVEVILIPNDSFRRKFIVQNVTKLHGKNTYIYPQILSRRKICGSRLEGGLICGDTSNLFYQEQKFKYNGTLENISKLLETLNNWDIRHKNFKMRLVYS